jgi:ribonucleoside-diphosphate reductase alpha chain
MGHTKNPDIRIAKSIVDYIFRWLGITFLPGYREANRGLDEPAASVKSPATEDAASELKPAAKKVGGQAGAQGSDQGSAGERGDVSPPMASGVRRQASDPPRSNGHHTNSAGNGTASKGAGVQPKNVVEDNAALLQRAGVALRLDPGKAVSNRDEQFATFQLDAPSCDNCGAITVRNGNCYLCHNCGNSMGCS